MMDKVKGWEKIENKDFLCFQNEEGYEVSISDHYRWGNPDEPTGKYEVIVHKDGEVLKKFISTRDIYAKYKLKHILLKATRIIMECE